MSKFNNAGKLLKLILTIPPILSLLATFTSIARFEVAVMKRNVCLMVILTLLALIFLMATWASVCAMMIIYLVSMQVSLLAACGGVLVLNLFLLVLTMIAFVARTRSVRD